MWRAHDGELDRVVAVKCAHTHGDDHIRLLRREARLLARVNHPHVVTVFDRVLEGDEWCIVMEHLAGSLAEAPPLPAARVARIGEQLADALETLHAKGIVHGDVKRGNVLLTETGAAKLSDFGVSRVERDEETLSGSGVVYGTPGYVAPEVAMGDRPSAASDMYSLGATLYIAVEGRTPFGDIDNRMLLLRKAVDAEVFPPRRAGDLAPVIAALLSREPSRRPDAATSRRALRGVADGGPADLHGRFVSAAGPAGSRPARTVPRRALLWAAAAVVVLALAAWGALQLPFGSPQAKGDIDSRPVMGSPTTADPCSLLSEKSFKRFGRPHLDPAYGNFNRCDVLVDAGSGDADVQVELDRGDRDEAGGKVEASGPVDVVRTPENDGECARDLILADDNRVEVTAAALDGKPRLCPLAEAAVDHAVTVLSHGEIPRRHGKPDPSSLIRLNACDLLDDKAADAFPGVDRHDSTAGFGNWQCRWHSADSGHNLLIGFDHDSPLSNDDGKLYRLSGHPAVVEPDGYSDDSCQVSVSNRVYANADGDRVAELVVVVVMGDGPKRELCDAAKAVAAPVAAEIPGS